MSLYQLTYPPAELIWGLFSRGLGLCFLISFASMALQVLPIAGERGITPIGPALRAIERDFPSWKRFFYFPTFLWLSSRDGVLAALPRLGVLAALSCIVGGPHTPYAFAFCYLAYISLDRPLTLVYPWDCMLFEAAFWGMFLPATRVLPALDAVAAPLPAVAWVFRLLVFRVMLGFGKHKFMGKTAQDAGFLKTFFVSQPLPTPLGWLVQKLPMPVMKLSLLLMFVVEIPLPLLVFFPGVWASAAALVMMAFMLAIWATGNFGYFNLAMIVLSISWLDNTTASALSLPDYWSPQGPLFVHALVALHTTLASWAFAFNTFCAQTWMQWSIWSRMPRLLSWPATLARVLHPLRWVHAYGVFPSRSAPAARLMPVLEATWDDNHWHTLSFRHAPTTEHSKPTYCAPHHERFDQAVIYEGLGLNESSAFRNTVGRWDPYGYGGVPAARVLMHRMLLGEVPGDRFYDRSLERAHGKPLAVRARSYLFEPATLQEQRESGRYWRRSLAGPHFAPLTRAEAQVDAPLPSPELWHFDDLIWLRRSKLGALMQRARRGHDVHALLLTDSDGLQAADVDLFWNDFVPRFGSRHRDDWRGLRASVTELRASYGHAQLQRMERVAARYAALLFARVEPLFLEAGLWAMLGLRHTKLDARANYHLRLLAYHVVGEGRASFDAVMADPQLIGEQLARLTMFSGARLCALFRYEELVFQSQHLRALECWSEFAGRAKPSQKQQRTLDRVTGVVRRLWGVIEYCEFLKTQFTEAEDQLDVPESWPRFALTADHDVVRIG